MFRLLDMVLMSYNTDFKTLQLWFKDGKLIILHGGFSFNGRELWLESSLSKSRHLLAIVTTPILEAGLGS
jgi:hypothetical protein